MKTTRLFEGKRLAILTGGGDTAALNASIEAIKCRAAVLGYKVYGILRGWKGLLGDGDVVDLTGKPYDGWYGGTALLSSRTNPFPTKNNPVNRVDQVLQNLKRYKIDVLVTIGGDDTNGAAKKLYEQEGIPVIGFPKTIDNDVRTRTFHEFDQRKYETSLCPGFPSAAINIAEFTAKLRTTAESHSRILVMEIMGRDAGWLTGSAMFGGAKISLIPEYEMTKENIERFYEKVKEMYQKCSKKYLIIAVAEGTKWYNEQTGKVERVCASSDVDEYGHHQLGGISGVIASEIKKKTGIDARSQIVGYYARSGECSIYDKRFCNVLSDKVLDLLLREEYGKMPVLTNVSTYKEIEEYNCSTIDMGQIENFPLPDYFYDKNEFQFNNIYDNFLGHMIERPKKRFFDVSFEKVMPTE